MALIVSIEEGFLFQGAIGTLKARSEDGSLFIFRLEYLPSQAYCSGIELPLQINDDLLYQAVEATLAEVRALSLLSRAEQFRSRLELKLAGRGISRPASKAALDRLEASGLLSDRRYAESWIRARLRNRVEGPRSLASALSSRGVAASAIKMAIKESLEGEDNKAYRHDILYRIATKCAEEGSDRRTIRRRLSELGWRHIDIDELLDDIGL